MKRVLVTGADGFIGSHLTESLVRKGFQVRALCQYNSFSSPGWIDTFETEILSQIEIVFGDIRDKQVVKNAMHNIDTVYHLAALIAIPFSFIAVESYVDTNIKGTLNILEVARDTNISRILVTSTSEVYGTAKSIPIDETHPRQPQSPYSATKIGADAIAESYHRSFGTPVTIVRPFNTYGPRQSARAIIPAIITQLLNGVKEIKLGNLKPTRDLVYVEDTIEGFQRIAITDSLIGEDVNIATEHEISIEELAKELIQQINPSAVVINEDLRLRPETSEVYRLLGSAQKLLLHTGWKPEIDLNSGLKKTIDWFKTPYNLTKYKHDKYTI
jgi:NAD dependent epimerase/dehydratase